MRELGLEDLAAIRAWFPHQQESPYVLIRVSAANADSWSNLLATAVRRCYASDAYVTQRSAALAEVLHGTDLDRQRIIIQEKMPDAGAVMSGDFGEILVYIYQSAFYGGLDSLSGPKKWRLKEVRTRPAPLSDVVQFYLPSWPVPSEGDAVICSEVKAKATRSASTPILDAIDDCQKDRTSRLAKTLSWIRSKAIAGDLAPDFIAKANRFIESDVTIQHIKKFNAVAVICESLLDAELRLNHTPDVSPADYSLIIIGVPSLHVVYGAVLGAAAQSTVS